jgi:hypothetical protein
VIPSARGALGTHCSRDSRAIARIQALRRNTRAEIAEKISAYLAAGAREVWVVDDAGLPEIHTSAGQAASSALGFTVPRPPAA